MRRPATQSQTLVGADKGGYTFVTGAASNPHPAPVKGESLRHIAIAALDSYRHGEQVSPALRLRSFAKPVLVSL